jgi:hypothetical protein
VLRRLATELFAALTVAEGAWYHSNMKITLSDRHAEIAKKHAAEAGFDDVGEYIQYVLEADEGQDEQERAEVIAAIHESEADIAAGRGRPFREVFADIAKKHGITLPDEVESAQ